MKKVIVLTALLASGASYAHSDNNINISAKNCDLTFQNTLRISPHQVEIATANQQTMVVESNGAVTVAGKSLPLSPAEQSQMQDYADNLRGQVPQVAEIAMDGVKLAGAALDEVGAAFGIDSMTDMQTLMDDVAKEIEHGFYQDGTFVMDQGGFDAIGDTFDAEFDAKIETAMEQMVMESIGSLLVTLGTELLTAGGDFNKFEQRMENMGKQIEEKVERQAANLEQRANGLCLAFAELAKQEDEIQQQLPQLKAYDVFALNQ